MYVVLQHLLPKGAVPPPVGYPLRLAQARHRDSCASGNVVAVASPVGASVPRHPGQPCAGWMPPTSSPLDRDRGAFAPAPDPTSRGFRAPCTHDQPCAGWMRVNLIAVEWRPGACGAPGPGRQGQTSALPPSPPSNRAETSLSPCTPIDQPCAGWIRHGIDAT